MIFPHGLLGSTLIALLSTSITADLEQRWQKTQDQENVDPQALQKLLDSVEPASLHAALHNLSPKHYQHGMFREDRTAVEMIHQEEPSLATSILNLAKRQAPDIRNGSVPTTSAASPPSSAAPAALTPDSSPLVQTSAAPSRATPVPQDSQPSTSAPAPASSAAPAPSSAPASSVAGTTAASTPASAATTTSPAGGSSSYTKGQVVTMTNSQGYRVITTIGGGATTITPSASSSSTSGGSGGNGQTSLVLITSTGANGQQSVMTSVMVVGGGNGNNPTATVGAGGTATGKSPGLQTGEAIMTRGFGWEGVGVLLGAMGFAVMM